MTVTAMSGKSCVLFATLQGVTRPNTIATHVKGLHSSTLNRDKHPEIIRTGSRESFERPEKKSKN